MMSATKQFWHRIGILTLAGVIALGAILPGQTTAASAAGPGVFDRADDVELAAARDELAFAAQSDQVDEGPAVIGGPIEEAPRPWTREEMLEAKPLPPPKLSRPAGGAAQEVDADAAGPDGPPGFLPGHPPAGEGAGGAAGMDDLVLSPSFILPVGHHTQFPYRTAGKVFFQVGARRSACSAASIGNYAVFTAGHCVYTRGTGFHTNFVFVPGAVAGRAPFGQWRATNLYASGHWTGGSFLGFSFDYGGAVLRKLDNRKISERVGALGLAYNQPRNFHAYRVLGYPGFANTTMHWCDGRDTIVDATRSSPFPRGIRNCSLGQGISGGPWLIFFRGAWYLAGDNSYGWELPTIRRAIYSPFLNNEAKTFVDFLRRQVPQEAEPCDRLTKSGGQGRETHRHQMGEHVGRFNFFWKAFSIPDRFIVRYEGRVILDTGKVSGSGQNSVRFGSGGSSSTEIEVEVIADERGTAWEYTVNCPTGEIT